MDEVHVVSASELCVVSRYDRNCVVQGFLRPASAPPKEGVLWPRNLFKCTELTRPGNVWTSQCCLTNSPFGKMVLYMSFHMPLWISIM